MADAAVVSVLIQARDQASASLKNVERNMGRMAEGFGKHRRTIGIASTAIGAAITGIGILSVKSSLDQQVGINRLDQALKNVSTSYGSQKVEIEKLVAAQQNKTNYGDEAQREALQKLVTIGGKWEGSLNALTVATDVAAGANIDLNAAALLVGKAIAGETSSLSRYGIVLEKGASETEIMAALTKQFGGAAEAAADPITQLKNRVGDLFQVFGDALLPMLEALLPKIDGLIQKFMAWAEEHPTLIKVLGLVAAGVGAMMAVVGPLLLLLPGLSIAFGILSASLGPITLIVLGIAAAITAGIVVWQNWELIVQKAKEGLAAFGAFIIDIGIDIAKGAKALIGWIPGLGGMKDGIDAAIDSLEGMKDGLSGWAASSQKTATEIGKSNDSIVADQKAVTTEAAKTEKAVTQSQKGVIKSTGEVARSYGTLSRRVGWSTDQIIGHTKRRAAEIMAAHAEEQRLQEESARNLQLRTELGFRLQMESWNKLRLIYLDEQELRQTQEEGRDRSLDRLRQSLDATNIAWRESGSSMEDVVKAWATVTGTSVEDVLGRLDTLNVDTNDVKATLQAFASETGEDFLDWSSNVKESLKVAGEASKAAADEMKRNADRIREGGWLTLEQEKFLAENAPESLSGQAAIEAISARSAASASEFLGRTGTAAESGAFQEQLKVSFAKGTAGLTAGHMFGQGFSTGTGQTTVAGAIATLRRGQTGAALTGMSDADLVNIIAAQNPNAPLGNIDALGLNIDKKALGGFSRGGLTLVGERGPEIVNLPPGSFVNPHGSRGGGGVNNFHFHGAVYGLEDLRRVVVEAVRDHAISGGFRGVFGEA